MIATLRRMAVERYHHRRMRRSVEQAAEQLRQARYGDAKRLEDLIRYELVNWTSDADHATAALLTLLRDKGWLIVRADA